MRMASHRRDRHLEASRRARTARDLLAIEWLVLTIAVALVIVAGFGLRFLIA
jgi:hypothetical protein